MNNQGLTRQNEQGKVQQIMANNNTIHPEREYKQKTAWVYLFNLIFYFIPLWFMKEDLLRVGVSLLLLIPFLYSYFWAYKSSSAKGIYPIGLMLLTASVAAPFTSGAISFFSFAAFFIGFFYSLRTAALSFIVISAWLWALDYLVGYQGYYFPLYGMLIVFIVGVFGVIEHNSERFRRQQRQSKDEIASLATALERERIARDLHDIMGHNLSSIALKAQLAEKLVETGNLALAQEHLSQLANIARESLSQIRQTVSDYKHKGLADTLQQLTERLREQSIEVQVSGSLPNMPSLIASQLGLMLTELVNNTIKHGNATQCLWQFETTNEQLTINFSDNAATKEIIEGNGLKGIRERVELLSGEFNYETTNGYRFMISLPITTSEINDEQVTPNKDVN
ncbi:sensor histidine kinase [Shewanella goraebulensis]|uniref:sensor histidine kinase n=1 Tax=Shewanella goraebulensis TaxID=3050637 RepID=UPI00254F07FE|nr:sensor histidine kinase [Shewanella goraebulensis]